MPNDCVNRVTIIATQDMDAILREIRMISNVRIDQRGPRGIRIEYVTAWKPNYAWLQRLVDTYPACWVKDRWISEDGLAGIWVGDIEKRHIYEWQDLSIEDEIHFFG